MGKFLSLLELYGALVKLCKKEGLILVERELVSDTLIYYRDGNYLIFNTKYRT